MYRKQSEYYRKRSPQRSHHWNRIFLGTLISVMMLVAIPSSVVAKEAPASPSIIPSQLQPQIRELERTLPGFSGLLRPETSEVAKGIVRLDGQRLFTIAVPILGDEKNQQENQTPIETRIDIVESRLQNIVDQGFTPETLQVTSETDPNSGQPILYASYEVNGSLKRDELLTITALDADVNGTTAETWADDLTSLIQNALVEAQQERRPGYLKQQGIVAAVILTAMGISSLIISRFQRRLQKERRRLSVQTQSDSQEISVASTTGEVPKVTTALLQRQAANRQRQGVNDIKRRFAQVGQIAIWGIGFYVIVGLFPYTRWLQPLMLQFIQIPLRISAIAIVAYLGFRFLTVLIDRLVWALQSSTSIVSAQSQRIVLRFTTLSRVAKSIAAIVCGSIGVISAISVLGVQISPALLTLAGIVGVGISLASQNLIKDMINGFLILLEDQYGVGDVIIVGDVSGLVENMNLRITQLRNEEGRLITIPNSSITVVQNLSKEWSRVDLSISVAYEADLTQALTVIERIAQDMSHDPKWQDLILEAPQLLGVDKLDYVGATIRLWIKTQPLKQWEVAREYRRRLKLAFDEANIPIGIPQQSLWLSNAANPEAHDDRTLPVVSRSGQPIDRHRH